MMIHKPKRYHIYSLLLSLMYVPCNWIGTLGYWIEHKASCMGIAILRAQSRLEKQYDPTPRIVRDNDVVRAPHNAYPDARKPTIIAKRGD